MTLGWWLVVLVLLLFCGWMGVLWVELWIEARKREKE